MEEHREKPAALLQVTGISKLHNGREALAGVSFHQHRFQKIALAGETGSGKSTLMRIIAGLIRPDAGLVLFEGKRVEGPDEKLIPGHPRIAYLSQQFELRNNYRVEELLDYASRLPAQEAAVLFDLCRISHLLKRRTDQLSGGEKQRIALARLLVTSPSLLLLDEPFSNLDPIHKAQLKAVIKDVGDQLGLTSILISHDPLDTLSWADEVFVMKDGRFIAQGIPQAVYRHPTDAYTAALFGKYNLLPPALQPLFPGLQRGPDGRDLYIRPEYFRIHTQGPGVPGEIKDITFMGSYFDVEVTLDATPHLVTVRTGEGRWERGDRVSVSLSDL